MPEIYFLTERVNPTFSDTPYATYSMDHQNRIVNELENAQDETIIYNPNRSFGGLTPNSLSIVKEYIENEYSVIKEIGAIKILK